MYTYVIPRSKQTHNGNIYIYIYTGWVNKHRKVPFNNTYLGSFSNFWAAFDSFWQFFYLFWYFFLQPFSFFISETQKGKFLTSTARCLLTFPYIHTFNIILINFIYHYKFFDKFICWNSVCLQRQFCSHHNLNGLFARWLSSLSSARANWYHHEDQFAKTYNQTIKIFI